MKIGIIENNDSLYGNRERYLKISKLENVSQRHPQHLAVLVSAKCRKLNFIPTYNEQLHFTLSGVHFKFQCRLT